MNGGVIGGAVAAGVLLVVIVVLVLVLVLVLMKHQGHKEVAIAGKYLVMREVYCL